METFVVKIFQDISYYLYDYILNVSQIIILEMELTLQ